MTTPRVWPAAILFFLSAAGLAALALAPRETFEERWATIEPGQNSGLVRRRLGKPVKIIVADELPEELRGSLPANHSLWVYRRNQFFLEFDGDSVHAKDQDEDAPAPGGAARDPAPPGP